MSVREPLEPLRPPRDAGGPRLFQFLAAASVAELEPELVRMSLKGGQTLFSAGEPGDALYFVLSGRLRALVADAAHGVRVLGEIGRGESVGEMALLSGEPRSATVCAVRDTELVALTKQAFERVIERRPHLMLELSRQIIARYQRVIRAAPQVRPVALAIVPYDDRVPIAELTASLVDVLSRSVKVLTLDPARLKHARGIPDVQLIPELESPALAEWLHEQELRHDFLVYVADPRLSPWTRLCLRQVDLVLVVASGDSPAETDPELLNQVRSRDRATGARTELVLLYDSGASRPGGTAGWLARMPAVAHHHVDPHSPRDVERLARLLTGKAIGLVLGGGGARGFAHIGVVRALEEAGIPVDLVGGTSIGALLGAQLAAGWDSRRMLAESRRVLVDNGSLNDFTLPVIALLRGRRYKRALASLFADSNIEDLPISFFCVSTNLTRSTCVVHRDGPVWKWVGASMAVPGLAPPLFDGTDVLVDGGLVNNLPVDVMRNAGRGLVFASSVARRFELRLEREYNELLSPWRVLLSWLMPFGSKMPVPTMPTILIRCASLQTIMRGYQGADLVFELPDERHKLLDWKACSAIVEAGYRAAVEAIEKWQAARRGASADARGVIRS